MMAHNMRRQRCSKTSSSLVRTKEDDWTNLSDSKERRRVQNRLAQRQYRKTRKTREQQNAKAQYRASSAHTLAAYYPDTALKVNEFHVFNDGTRGAYSEQNYVDSLDQIIRRASQVTSLPGFRSEDLEFPPQQFVTRAKLQQSNSITCQPLTPGSIYQEHLIPEEAPWCPQFSNDQILGDLSLDIETVGTYDGTEQWIMMPSIERSIPQSETSTHEFDPLSPGNTLSSIQSTNTRSTFAVGTDHHTHLFQGAFHSRPDYARNSTGGTMLHLAAEKGHVSIIELLLESGLEVNAVDSLGQSALHMVAIEGRHDATRVLLERNANVNWRDSKGQTALFLASQKGHERVVKLLLNWKADVNVRDITGCAPLQSAIQEGHEGVVRLLLKAGGDLKGVANKWEDRIQTGL